MDTAIGSNRSESSTVSSVASQQRDRPDPANQGSSEYSNVAVIAIHGVGQHATGASADAVSTLLLSLEPCANEQSSQKAVYAGFVSTSIDVPLEPVRSPRENADIANQRNQRSVWERLIGIFDERRGFLAHVRKNADYDPPGYRRNELRPGEPDRGEYGYQFMVTQLAGYKGEVDRDFHTVRLEGKRVHDTDIHHVHIYDAHYSDLTKPQSNILAFFFAFYQLLFHLASLSLMAVYWAEAENVRADKHRRKLWRIESSIHATSVRFLLMWVPILNVVLLELGCCAFIDKLTGSRLRVSSLAGAGVAGLAAMFLARRKRESPPRPFLWSLIPFAGVVGGIAVLVGLSALYDHAFHVGNLYATLLLFDWLLIAGVLLALVAGKFDQLRPGAYALSVFLYLVNTALFLTYLLPKAPNVATAALWAVRLIFAELIASWIVCLGSAFLSWPLSAWCIRGIRHDEPRRARAIAAFRTGRFAFSIPAILFVIVTCALWSGVLVYGSYKLKAFDNVTCAPAEWRDTSVWSSILVPEVYRVETWMARVDPRLQIECQAKSSADFWHVYLVGLLLTSVTPSLFVTMVLFTLGLFLLIWAVLPSVVFELEPEWTRNSRTAGIRALGSWLSRGLDNTAILTRLFWFAIVPIPLFFLGFDWHAVHHAIGSKEVEFLDRASRLTLPLIQWEGAGLAVTGAAVFAFVLKYLTTILDAILDVDNYLRTSPLDQTPRARIAERVVSLLRYVAAYRDDQGRPYSKLIIVAHSLGTLVTADLLRYLERSGRDAPDPALVRYQFRGQRFGADESNLPICLFSMGSPLRQLLNRFFPHLYWWISDEPDNSLHPLGEPLHVGPEIKSKLPRTDEMNATLWANAYRSGDYIGRSLWVGQWFERNATDDPNQEPDSATASPPLSCYEMCIGAGAHTHYWDRSAPPVGFLLDELIRSRSWTAVQTRKQSATG